MKELNYEKSIRLKFNSDSTRTSFRKLEEAIESANDQDIYKAIGELLLWVITTDEWHMKNGLSDYKNRKLNDENGKLISGLKYAFNCFKHNMDFFQLHRQDGGIEFPLEFPIEIEEIKVLWMPVGFLASSGYENQAKNYKKRLEGLEVIDTFKNAVYFLNKEFSNVYFK